MSWDPQVRVWLGIWESRQISELWEKDNAETQARQVQIFQLRSCHFFEEAAQAFIASLFLIQVFIHTFQNNEAALKLGLLKVNHA